MLAGVFGGLALGVVEVGRNRYDCSGDGFTKVVLGGLLHLFQHCARDLRRCELLTPHFHPRVAVVGFRRSCRGPC